MRTLINIVIIAGMFTLAVAQERTTSEIKRDFEKEFKSLMTQLRSADSTKIEALKSKVEGFKNDYKGYADLLNKAVFPDGYNGTVERLEDQLQESIDLVDSKGRIAMLEAQIRDLSGQVDSLNQQNTMLLEQMKQLKSEVASLRKVVAQLQSNIAKRDAAVFALVDSLFVQYDKQQLSNADMKKLSSLEKNNVVSNIKRSLNDNLSFLSSMALSSADLPNLLEQQRKFENSWRGVGSKLADAYLSSKDRQKEIAEVESMLSQWKTQVDEAFWKALNNVFTQEKVNIAAFTNSDEFYNNVIKYLDDEINNASNKENEERVNAYEAFAYKTWGSQVKPVWIPVMKRYNMFSDDKVNEIDTKVKLWYEQVKPGNTLLYALGAALALAILIGLYLGMRKRPAATSAA